VLAEIVKRRSTLALEFGVDYDTKIQEQIQQFETGLDVHPLPPIFHHWSHTHLREKAIAVFGVQTVTEFYASQFAPI
jgi:hypothetical protein